MVSWLLRSAVAAAAFMALPGAALPQATDSGPGSGSGSGSKNSTACNNSPDLCGRKYNNVTHMGAHGSSFLRGGNGISAAGNQNLNATRALDAGLRLLQAQVHKENSTLQLCHTTCDLLDGGPLQTWLSSINDWMKANPNDVVTVLLVNSDEASADELGSVFKNSGLADIAYKPATEGATGEWPTLQSMIDDNARLVSFATNIKATTKHPYLMPEFQYVFETAFEVTSIDGFNCSLHRPSRLQSASSALSKNYLSLVNHFKYQTLAAGMFVPDVETIGTVNSPATSEDGNLGKHLQQCRKEWGTVPNFVLVDFFEEGDVLKAADTMNSVSSPSGREKVDESETDDKSLGSRSSRSLNTGALLAFIAGAMLLL